MKADLTWLVAKHLTEVIRHEPSWSFVFGDDDSVSTSSFWRLVAPDGIIVTSQDDGHPFGLGTPVDARVRVIDRLRTSRVTGYALSEITSDLTIHFEGSAQLEFLNTSCGYESWTAFHKPFQTICMGGGGISVWDTERPRA